VYKNLKKVTKIKKIPMDWAGEEGWRCKARWSEAITEVGQKIVFSS